MYAYVCIAIHAGLYVCRSQLSSGSKVDPDEFPLWVDQSEGSRQKYGIKTGTLAQPRVS